MDSNLHVTLIGVKRALSIFHNRDIAVIAPLESYTDQIYGAKGMSSKT